MRTVQKCLAVLLVFALSVGFAVVPAFAQDEMMAHTCDSTLVTLLLVAEHDYHYLTDKMAMGEEAPAIELGQYGPVFDSIMAMMMEETEMSEEDAAMMESHDMMLAEMMAMDTAGMVAAYMSGMDMAMEGEMMPLTPGNVADEDPVCAEVRADVEAFILAHILTEMSMVDADM